MNKFFPIAIALLAIGFLCALEGLLTGRYGEFKSELLGHFTSVIDDVPTNFEDWDGVDNDPTKDIVLQEAGAVGHLSRTYVNHAINEQVSLYYICGPSHKVAIHAPTACYPGSGYTQEGEVVKHTFLYPYIDAESKAKYMREADFFMTIFARGSERLRVFWSWNDGTRWEAPTSPRSRYSGLIPLNKCYMITKVTKEEARNEKLSDLAVNHFARMFLSYVDGAMLKNGELPFSNLDVKLGDPIDVNATIVYDDQDEGDTEPKTDKSATSHSGSEVGAHSGNDSAAGTNSDSDALPNLSSDAKENVRSGSDATVNGDSLPGLDGSSETPDSEKKPDRSLKTLEQTLPGIEDAVTPNNSGSSSNLDALPTL